MHLTRSIIICVLLTSILWKIFTNRNAIDAQQIEKFLFFRHRHSTSSQSELNVDPMAYPTAVTDLAKALPPLEFPYIGERLPKFLLFGHR